MPARLRFSDHGLLPPGDYALTLGQLAESPLVAGVPDGSATWDSAWRARLVANLSALVEQLWAVGIEEIYIDGSFAEAKDRPNDIDGYFVCDPHRFAAGELERDLNRLDPAKCWTWDHRSRRPCRGSPKLQLPMWHAYRVELYPHFPGLIAGVDEYGQPLEFPAFFRKTRDTGEPKGIIRIVREPAKELP